MKILIKIRNKDRLKAKVYRKQTKRKKKKLVHYMNEIIIGCFLRINNSTFGQQIK